MMIKFKMQMMYIILFAFVFSLSSALAAELTRTTLKVSNLYCGACLIQIDAALKSIPEVKGMDGSIEKGIVSVDHSVAFKGERIASKITKMGYPAEIQKQSTIDEKNAFSFKPDIFSRRGCCGSTGGPGNKKYRKYGGCGATAASWKKLLQHFQK